MVVSDQIIQVLDALCEKFGLVVDWTSENVIPYLATLCTKLISYEIWSSVVWIVSSLTVFITMLVIVKPFGQRFKDMIKTFDCEGLFTILGLILFAILVGGICLVQIMDIVKCVTFPEMHIFEYVQYLINSGS